MSKDVTTVGPAAGEIEVEASPFPFRFDPREAALIVIDMQRDFLEEGGFGASLGNDVSRLSAIVPTVAALLALARERGWTIVHTRECHAPDLSDCPPAKRERGAPALRIGDLGPMGRILVRGEPGADIVPELAPAPGEIVLDKPGKGAFHATALGEILRKKGVVRLILAGVTTEVCVQTTMREANDRGYDCLLIEDATESYFPRFKAAALEMIQAQGGIVGWTAPFAALRRAAGASEPALAAAPFEPEAHFDALCATLALPVRPEWREDALTHLAALKGAANKVLAVEIQDELDAAETFRPQAVGGTRA